VLFDLSLFANEADRENSQKRVLWLLEALTCCDQLYLQQHPETPLIYQSGIKYIQPAQFEHANVPEVKLIREYLEQQGASQRMFDALDKLYNIVGGGEIFREIPRIILNGGGDCDNVAAWRCAELRELGIAACPYITWRTRGDGGMTYHVIVRWPDGSSEDPSLLLGMGGASRASDRAEEERKLAERLGNYVQAFKARGPDVAEALIKSGASDQLAGVVIGARRLHRQHPSRTDFALAARRRRALHVLGAAINSPQNYNQLQYTIPFQTDDAYEDWSPTRPQSYYMDPRYPKGSVLNTAAGPIFNTRMFDPDRDFDEPGFDRMDRFDGAIARKKLRHLLRRGE
jgi:hypothetical protein